MKNYLWFVTFLAGFMTASINAQEATWNDAQKEVWALVEQTWVDDVAENGKWPASYIHANYVTWGASMAAPRYKDSAIAWSRFSDENSKTLMYEVTPAAIVIAKDTAVVHYHATTVSEDSKGKRKQEVSRISEVLVRDGSTWKWIAGVSFEPKLND